MTTYIALLRGINVGGKNKIKMAELRDMMVTMGLKRVQTYIQSGNVLFESKEEVKFLQGKIEQNIEKKFGYPIKVILRTSSEWVLIMESCPFTELEIKEAEATAIGESLYVSIHQDVPTQEEIDRLEPYNRDKENFRIQGGEIYLLFQESIRNSKLTNQLQKFNAPSTVRNWKTMNKLFGMVKAMEKSV
jgi:uncharacterized protein (DUF1697 family)